MRNAIFFGMIFSGLCFAQNYEYIGTYKCKNCHKKDEMGAQYKVWEKAAHSKAFETLGSDKAKGIAKERGIEGSPQESAECLGCHTVGFGKGGYEVKDKAFWEPAPDDKEGLKAVKRMESLQGVGCESCHGPGSEYESKKTMTAIFEGKAKPEDHGLLIPNEETCLGCHNEKSPTFTPFDYKERLKKIAHPYPEGVKKS